MFADMKSVRVLKPVVRRYALTLPNGAEIFSEFSTVEAYMANEAAQKQVRLDSRRARIWSAIDQKKVAQRVRFVADGRNDYSVLRPEPVASKTASSFGAMIAAEMQKAGL